MTGRCHSQSFYSLNNKIVREIAARRYVNDPRNPTVYIEDKED